MFANRYTVLVDACSLVGVLRRNILLSLAESALFRLRWNDKILEETETAIQKILTKKSFSKIDAKSKALVAVSAMKKAFPEAEVTGYSIRRSENWDLPDVDDAHVIEAAVHTRASMIVTENLKHFPAELLNSLGLEAKSSDEFIADAIELDEGLAVAAIARMRERFKKPEMTAEDLLRKMESQGLTSTAASLGKYKNSL